ncbi:MAG: peptidoglycan DL-endopeptidase CwlO [Acidimicrobiaceae bacterium]|nr:peptidoglycan DL-endopeptidase CwlO [Acidimicrobiaceae bacterium]
MPSTPRAPFSDPARQPRRPRSGAVRAAARAVVLATVLFGIQGLAMATIPAAADAVSDKAQQAIALSQQLDVAKQKAGDLGADYLRAAQRATEAQQAEDAALDRLAAAKRDEAAARRRVADVAVSLYVSGRPDTETLVRRASVTGIQAAANVYIDAVGDGQDSVIRDADAARNVREGEAAAALRAAKDAKTALAGAEAARQGAVAAQDNLQVRLQQTRGELAAAVAEQQALLAAAAKTQLEAAVPTGPPPAASPSAALAVSFALAQLGKPYQWGAVGPASFDCSGLTSRAWLAAGKTIPRVASDQQAAAAPVAITAAQPGDLVFFGAPAHHVGLYLGNGMMLDAPQTGALVRVEPVWWSDLAGMGRVF